MEMTQFIFSSVKYPPTQKSLAPKNQILPMENKHSDSMKIIKKTTEIIFISNKVRGFNIYKSPAFSDQWKTLRMKMRYIT